VCPGDMESDHLKCSSGALVWLNGTLIQDSSCVAFECYDG